MPFKAGGPRDQKRILNDFSCVLSTSCTRLRWDCTIVSPLLDHGGPVTGPGMGRPSVLAWDRVFPAVSVNKHVTALRDSGPPHVNF